MSEEWREVIGYENYYLVSNYGNVKSLDRKVWNGKGYYEMKGRNLKKSKTTTGYWKVELTVKGKKKSKRIHRLVAKSFIPLVDGKELINHKDGDPLNNHVSNLEWCTQSENMQHAYDIGLMSTLHQDNHEEIVSKYNGNKRLSISSLASEYKCSHNVIKRILKENEVKVRGVGHYQDKYNIDRKELVAMFDSGERNIDISKKLSTSYGIIATYRSKHKKGELII